MLRLLVERRVVADAVADEGFDSEAFSQAKQLFLKQKGIDSDGALKSYLMQVGMNEEHLDWQITLPLRVSSYCQTHYRHKAEAHFLARKNQLDSVVYNLLRLKNFYTARELYFRIEAGETSFGELAREYSEGLEKETQGIVGPVSLTQAHPALAELLRTTPPGVLIPPIQIGEWWLVVRVESYTPACFSDAIAKQMSEELFNQWVQKQASCMMSEIITRAVGTVKA